MPAPSDPLADYSGTEREIFDAALEGFVRDGRHGARMQAIADTVGLNKAILHYYFQGKATLYEEGLGYTIRRFMASFGESLRDAPTFEEMLRASLCPGTMRLRGKRHGVKRLF